MTIDVFMVDGVYYTAAKEQVKVRVVEREGDTATVLGARVRMLHVAPPEIKQAIAFEYAMDRLDHDARVTVQDIDWSEADRPLGLFTFRGVQHITGVITIQVRQEQLFLVVEYDKLTFTELITSDFLDCYNEINRILNTLPYIKFSQPEPELGPLPEANGF